MEHIKYDKNNPEQIHEWIMRNAMGLPQILDSTPTASGMKAHTIAKVKDATNYVYMKFGDGKVVRITVTAVT